jgi:integrase
MTSILDVASRGPRFARWLLAFHCGLRQGECLGLRWRDINLDHGFVVVRSTLVRLKWEHGCAEPCGRPAHKCAQRHGGGAVTMSPKSGEPRIAPLTPALVQALRTHAESQIVLRQLAGTDWTDDDFVFTNERGEPIGQKVDYNAWLRLLHDAGVRRTRLHNARHSSGTLMGSLGVPLRDIQGIFGHSSPKVTERYVHVLPTNLRRAADLVQGAFTHSQGNLTEEPTATKSDTKAEAEYVLGAQELQSPAEIWSRLGDLNPGPTHYECVALPLS